MSSVRWLAIGDWGHDTEELRHLSDSMARYVRQSGGRALDMIMACGDNFYPRGVLMTQCAQCQSWDEQCGCPQRAVHFTAPEFLCWEKVFLRHEELRVPWQAVLGNHDYQGGKGINEVNFTRSRLNPQGLWQLPRDVYSLDRGGVHFVFFDTCACQWGVRRVEKDINTRYRRNLKWLADDLAAASQARWRIVIGHHPLYTNGRGHQSESLCLRNPVYGKKDAPGMDFERHLVQGKVDVVIAGHEHVMQVKEANSILHVGCGASIESNYYNGMYSDNVVDWFELGPMGFVACEIVGNELIVKFIENSSMRVVREVRKTKE